jgi:hypothetical protein
MHRMGEPWGNSQTVTDQKQSEPQLFKNQIQLFRLMYWRGNMEEIDKLLPCPSSRILRALIHGY